MAKAYRTANAIAATAVNVPMENRQIPSITT